MNNNENISISKLLAVLDIQDDDSFIITDVELIDENKYIHIQKKLEPMYCPRCGSELIWSRDFSFEDCDIEGNGIVSYYTCSNSNCHTNIEVYTSDKEC